MTLEEAERLFNLVNQKYLQNHSKGLDNSDKNIFMEMLLDEKITYEKIAEQYNYGTQTVKEKAINLYRKTEEVFNLTHKTISKKNFKVTIQTLIDGKNSDINQQLAEPANQLNYLQQKINNPFIPLNGVVEDAELFFGRDHEIKRIFELLNSGSSVAVIGERAIGKSSVLKAVCREVANKLNIPRKPVEINLQNIDNDDDFYFALCDSIGIEDNILRGYALNRELQKHRLVLILDEVEKMTWTGFTNDIRTKLRGLAEGKEAPLRLVIAASKPLNDLFPDSHDSPMTSPFIGLCTEENIGLWNEQVILDFINHRLNLPLLRPDIKVTFSENEIVRIINESGGHPQKLMTLCYEIFNKYIQR